MLALALSACGPGALVDTGESADGGGAIVDAGGPSDSGQSSNFDAGSTDAGDFDAGVIDAGVDAGVVDAGVVDAGSVDAGAVDAGVVDAGVVDAGVVDAGVVDAGVVDAGVIDSGVVDAGRPDSGTPDAGCVTTITYGNTWLRPANHPDDFDVVQGNVTWDGACVNDGANSYAQLSNGWKPYFSGNGTCVIAVDRVGCGGNSCATRITYGTDWQRPAGHTAQYDDVSGRVLWDGTCTNVSGNSRATLSNGWTPTFTGADNCQMGLRYNQCGGLYANPVLASNCADPGVIKDGNRYVMSCTSGNAANAFPIYTSTDLINWTARGHIFKSADKPTWATGDFWAPEIHEVDGGYVAYFSARHTDGTLAVGAAWASSALGPFTDRGTALIKHAQGVIDVSKFEDGNGVPYLLWKVDGNSVNQPTPIFVRQLTGNGMGLTGTSTELITNDLTWEGKVAEAPFMIRRNGSYFLFYSGNSYANSSYAIGVAKASSPTGPFTKHGAPIVTTNVDWVGPGHNSVVVGPSGEDVLVYHAWVPGQVNTPGSGRKLLIDVLDWNNGWPRALASPSATSQPLP